MYLLRLIAVNHTNDDSMQNHTFWLSTLHNNKCNEFSCFTFRLFHNTTIKVMCLFHPSKSCTVEWTLHTHFRSHPYDSHTNTRLDICLVCLVSILFEHVLRWGFFGRSNEYRMEMKMGMCSHLFRFACCSVHITITIRHHHYHHSRCYECAIMRIPHPFAIVQWYALYIQVPYAFLCFTMLLSSSSSPPRFRRIRANKR